MTCACMCHMPGTKVHAADGEPCCACPPDPPPVRLAPPPGAKVSPLSPTVPQGRKHARI